MNRLEDFVMPSQKALYNKLRQMFKGNTISSKGSYILVPGDVPIMLVAHLDTVHKERVKQICKTHNGNILMSPQGIGGDDRCGVFALVKAHKAADFNKKPWLLFTCDEEIGGIGAEKFCEHHTKGKLPNELDELKLLVEIDRKGEKDAVYYSCANEAFEEYITGKGFETAYGSFSDISVIAPELGVAAVNLSSGYYNAHTLHEYINRAQLNATIEKVISIVADASAADFPKYAYIDDWGRDENWGDWEGTLRRRYTSEIALIPDDIQDEYEMLLDYYTPDELNEFRAEHGDSIIHQLFESEMGYRYADYKRWQSCDDNCAACDINWRCFRCLNVFGGVENVRGGTPTVK